MMVASGMEHSVIDVSHLNAMPPHRNMLADATGSPGRDILAHHRRRHRMAQAAKKLALLIDADNIDPKFYAEIVESLAERGSVVIRRAYGNPRTWNKKTLHTATLKHALTPVLVVPPIETKDAADMRLAIDAVDLIHAGWLDGIAIASSDSDFAALALRIAESGIAVHGFGETKTPEAFRMACTEFTVLVQPSARKPGPAARAAQAKADVPERLSAPARERAPAKPAAWAFPADDVLEAFDQSVRDDGWARLGSIRSALARRIGGFDQRHYGSAKFVSFLKQDPRFEFNEKRDAVRLKVR
jgi:uncharacterized protein (TIGR00288 family)